MALERRVSDALGLNVTIDHKGEGGVLHVEYKELEQLEDCAAAAGAKTPMRIWRAGNARLRACTLNGRLSKNYPIYRKLRYNSFTAGVIARAIPSRW